MTFRRLPALSTEVIDRAQPIAFSWNGGAREGFAGDTIASALAGSRVAIMSRSFKYHRPRGILTADYHDPNLMLQVGDEPNVRAGHRLLEPGMAVEAQNAWPSLRFDARSANRVIGRYLAPGFYYKTFISPNPLQPWYQRVLRRFGSGGTVVDRERPAIEDKRYVHPDVLVAGGGPAGMAAALGAAALGASVLLVDENHELGGHLRYGGPNTTAPLEELRARVAAEETIEVITDAVVAGRYDHNWVAVVARRGGDERLIKARAKCLVVAAGTIERPYVFSGNDLPGVMLSGAARRLINLWAVAPGSRAVVISANESGDTAAADLERIGCDVAEVLDLRQTSPQLVRARGTGRLASVELAGGHKIEADLLVAAVGWTTPTSLLNMAGDIPTYDEQAARFIPGNLPQEVIATGGIVGDGTLEALVDHGMAVGREAARRALGVTAAWLIANPRSTAVGPEPGRPGAIPPLPAAAHPELFIGETDGFIDFSEDVKGKDLVSAVAEGYDSIELSKRYTTATMGPIQGKLEVVNAVAAHARAAGSTIAGTGTTTWRPPYAPVTLGALAGAAEDPVRRSPMHDWHAAHGAAPLVAGQWIRPDHYGDPDAEVTNTRTNVGIIDVSPLGKIDLRGADVPQLLEFVYTNRWSQLAIGRVRYGVMCAEDGVVMDDGVTARLDGHHFYMTTTSGGAGRVWNWIDEWLQTRLAHLDVRMTAVSDGYAAVNVAGPSSRELISRLAAKVDLAPGAFPYMGARVGTIAGIPDCRLLRIGFTGELSYELHVPAGYGLEVWEALLDSGADLGVAPFGVEAQRIMRLEKGHFIVGQDTDGLTKGHAAGLGWAIKSEKPDFAGKPELAWEDAAGPSVRLVALQPDDPQVVPPEASQIIAGDDLLGRITSSRMSPTLGRSVCLAQVRTDVAVAGAGVVIRLPNGRDIAATILDQHAHYDPEGARLRV
jgi:sarcosine oxidase subunit alpha